VLVIHTVLMSDVGNTSDLSLLNTTGINWALLSRYCDAASLSIAIPSNPIAYDD
jgi:hypothetical protein